MLLVEGAKLKKKIQPMLSFYAICGRFKANIIITNFILFFLGHLMLLVK